MKILMTKQEYFEPQIEIIDISELKLMGCACPSEDSNPYNFGDDDDDDDDDDK